MSPAKLTKRCRAHGLAVDGDNRITVDSETFRVTVLCQEFVKSMHLSEARDDETAENLSQALGAAPYTTYKGPSTH